MAYTQTRQTKTKGTRFVGYYITADGRPRVAGTFASEAEALDVAERQERHIRGQRRGVTPAEKAMMTIEEFGTNQFIPRIDITPKAKQTYKSHLKNHVYPYLGTDRVAEIPREIIYNHLVTTLADDGRSLTTRRAVRTVLSSMLQFAWDDGYRTDNPVRTIRLKKVPHARVLVATHPQWKRLQAALPFNAAKTYARLNVTTWARQCEMRTLRPCDFEFGKTTMINITRSASYVTADNHPIGQAGWVVQPNAKNGDWRRFAISNQMSDMVQAHIAEYGVGDEDLLFPQWMFAYRRPSTGLILVDDAELLEPLVSPRGKVHEHGTMGARFTMKCCCVNCRAYGAWYARERQRRIREANPPQRSKASVWRQDGSEFLSTAVWARIWHAARQEAGLPEDFTPYNSRHTGISWAISQGADLGRVRQRAGHGSLEVTSRYQTILDEEDLTLADGLEAIFDDESGARLFTAAS